MEISVPLYYVLNRDSRKEEKVVVTALQVFGITPINCVIVSRPQDAEFALEFSQDIIQAVSDKDAVDLAQFVARESGQPVLIIGEADGLEALYDDGTKEKITC